MKGLLSLARGTAEIAIDLGTANTLIHVQGEGIVLDEPSVVALESASGRVVAVGLEAKRMLGRAPPGISVVRPMRGGVIGDVDRVDAMLRHFLQRVRPQGWLRRRSTVLITAPSGITEMERRALRAGIMAAGAGRVIMLSEPLAAAVGAGLPVDTPRASMVVNVGGGTTEIGVIALAGVVAVHSIRLAGLELDDVIASFIRRTQNLLIGEETAEAVKVQVGSAWADEPERTMVVRGRDVVSGIPRSADIGSEEIRGCLREPVQAMAAAVRATLEITPPELSADIVDDGIVLTGAGAQLRGLRTLFGRETGLPIWMAEDPATAVVRGAGAVLENLPRYRDAVLA